MRAWFAGMMLLLMMAMPAVGQTSKPPGISAGMPTWFAGPLGKQDFSVWGTRPSLPATPNLSSFMPDFSGLKMTLLQRNIFSGPAATVTIPQQAPPPQKKQKLLFLP